MIPCLSLSPDFDKNYLLSGCSPTRLILALVNGPPNFVVAVASLFLVTVIVSLLLLPMSGEMGTGCITHLTELAITLDEFNPEGFLLELPTVYCR